MRPFLFIVNKELDILWCHDNEMKDAFGADYKEVSLIDLFCRGKSLTSLFRWLISASTMQDYFKSSLVSRFTKSEFICTVTKCDDYFSFKMIQKENEDNFKELFWNHFTMTFPGGILCLSAENEIVEISNVVVNLFDFKNRDGINFSKNSLIGKSTAIFFEDKDGPMFSEIERKILEAKENRKSIESKFKINGKQIKLIFSSLYSSNHYSGCCIYFFDITDELRKNNLIKEQELLLYQSSKLASLGEMAGGIAHEINNPLAILKSRVGLLEKVAKMGKMTDAIMVKDLDKMSVTIDRIAAIINSMSNISRDSETDKIEPCNLMLIINDVLQVSTEKLQSYKINIQLNIDDNLKEYDVLCKRIQISQVLLNLVSNGLDALAEIDDCTKASLVLGAERDGDKIKIYVADNAKPIPNEILDKIFNPFFTTKIIGKGTGLGLSVSAKMIEEHGSMLKIEQHENNEFKRFFFSLTIAGE